MEKVARIEVLWGCGEGEAGRIGGEGGDGSGKE